MTLSQKFWKNDFFGHCSFPQLFHDVEKLRRTMKTFVKVIQRFWYVQHIGLLLEKFHQKHLGEPQELEAGQSLSVFVTIYDWWTLNHKPSKVSILVKKTYACYAFQDSGIKFLQPPLYTHCCLLVFFSKAATIKSKAKLIFNRQFLKSVASTFFLSWEFGSLEH